MTSACLKPAVYVCFCLGLHTYLINTVHVVLLKEIAKIANIFALEADGHRVMQIAQSFFPHFLQIGSLQRKHRSVVLLLQHLVEHVRGTLGTMQWWSKVVNFTEFICFCRSVTTARVATSEFFADLLHKSSATNFGFANDFVQYPAMYPSQVNYVISSRVLAIVCFQL